jgi:hypothetical protein
MHPLKKILLLWACGLAVGFLIGSFFSLSFSPAQWHEETRRYYCLGAGVFSFFTLLIGLMVWVSPPKTDEL